MLLGDEEGVEVPEAGFDKTTPMVKNGDLTHPGPILPVRRHLFETHLEEDLSEFVSNFVYYRDTC